MYKQIKGLFQKSQFTNLAVFEKLFRICGTIHLLVSLQQLVQVRLIRGCKNFPWKLIDGRKKLQTRVSWTNKQTKETQQLHKASIRRNFVQ